MDWVKICTDYYKARYYNNDNLNIFVIKGKITPEQYQTITGIEYVV